MAEFRTRLVVDAEPQARRRATNMRTCVVDVRQGWTAEEGGAGTVDFRGLFRRHYARIRSTCLEFAEPGIAVFAFERGGAQGWAGTMCLAARAGQGRAGVLGRHGEAELFLGEDPTVALRHLLFAVEPPSLRDAIRGEVRYRVLDLHTGSPPRDEAGRAVSSLTAEGPVLLACQRYAVMALVTGDPTDWPDSADDAWACLPERVFVEESLAPMASGSAPRRLPVRAIASAGRRSESGRRTTLVRTHAGPSHIAAPPPAADEQATGQLVVASGARALVIPAGPETLRRGLLIGRYERCQAGGPALIQSDRISRVHLIVIELAGTLHAIDLASTNGSHVVNDETGELVPRRIAPLGEETIALGDGEALVAWRPIEPGGGAEREVLATLRRLAGG